MKFDPGELPLPNTPYRGILPFRLLDWRIFLERDAETERLANLVSLYRGVLLYGQSGVGKSSLLNAGLIPDALRRGRAPERIHVFPKPGRELVVERIPLQEEDGADAESSSRYLPSRFTATQTDERVALTSNEFLEKLRAPSELGVPLLIFDQFEELVTLFEENPKDRDKFEAARTARLAIEKLFWELLVHDALPLKIVFGFRDDYLARLTPFFSRIPNLMDQGVRLTSPQIEVAQRIVRGPFVQSEDGRRGLPGHFRDELSDELATKIEEGIRERRPSGVLNLSELQTLCLALWQQPPRRDELLRASEPGAVLEKIIESEAMAALKSLTPTDRVRALAILSNLVTQEGTRDVVSEENLIHETRRMPVVRLLRGDLKKLLNTLLKRTGLLRRSLSSGNTYYELSSEFLIPWIQKLQKQQQAFRKVAAAFAFGGLVLVAIVMALLAISFKSQKIKAEAAETRAKELSKQLEQLNAQLKAADLAGALNSYRESLAIAQKLVKQDPVNADWQRDLSMSYDKVGDVQRAKGDVADALNSYRDSLAIREKLAKQDPGNADWQGDMAFSYWRTGTTLARAEPKSNMQAREMVEKGHDILRQLKQRAGLTAQQQQWLEAIEADLRKMHE